MGGSYLDECLPITELQETFRQDKGQPQVGFRVAMREGK
jgi:hypothetical protein